LRAALALHFAYYNFCRVHNTIKATGRTSQNGRNVEALVFWLLVLRHYMP